VAAAERQTRQAHNDTIRRLMVAAEYKDVDTAGHIERIGRFSEIVAKALDLAPERIELIRHAAPMHDVGKIGIPDGVLLKPGGFNDEERAIMRSHTRIGADILAGSDSEVIQMGATIALLHHERWDGGGYPQGIAGDAIAEEARICAIVDFFDASRMDRPYRPARPRQEVLDEMKHSSGTAFDPRLLDAFFRCLPDIERVRALD
jgi:putative two-component system response regulator